METTNPPSPLKAAKDPDPGVITGTGFSKPASAILSKHVSTSSHPSMDMKFPRPNSLNMKILSLKSSAPASRVA